MQIAVVGAAAVVAVEVEPSGQCSSSSNMICVED